MMTDKLNELEQRVVALEIGKQYDVTKEAVRAVEEEYLLKLREIKSALMNEKSSSVTTSSSSSKEIDELRKENELLKQKNLKLEYRVQHIVANMESMYKELKESKINEQKR